MCSVAGTFYGPGYALLAPEDVCMSVHVTISVDNDDLGKRLFVSLNKMGPDGGDWNIF